MRKTVSRFAPLLLAGLALSLTAPFAASLAHAQGMPGGMGGMGGDGGPGDGGGPGGGGPGGGGPGGGKPPAPVTIKRKAYDKLVAEMFQKADANRDGRVNLPELHAVLDARREAAILARFRTVDADANGAITLAEFSTWQKAMGAVAANDHEAGGDRDALIHDAIEPDPRGDDAGFMLVRLIEPLTGTALAMADADHDGYVSLAELTDYEGKRFEAADRNGDGFLSMDELRPRDGKGGGPGPGGPGGFGGPTGPGGPPPCPPGQTC